MCVIHVAFRGETDPPGISAEDQIVFDECWPDAVRVVAELLQDLFSPLAEDCFFNRAGRFCLQRLNIFFSFTGLAGTFFLESKDIVRIDHQQNSKGTYAAYDQKYR